MLATQFGHDAPIRRMEDLRDASDDAARLSRRHFGMPDIDY
jgi:hypothetical protein